MSWQSFSKSYDTIIWCYFVISECSCLFPFLKANNIRSYDGFEEKKIRILSEEAKIAHRKL